MPFIEQLLYGVNIKDKKPSKSVLAGSPGIGTEATAEITRLCDNWGTPPPLGLEQPALMSFRLTSTMPAIPGRLFTIICASRGLNPLFHAVVMSEGSYATFLRNPFAVAQVVGFRTEWSPEELLLREDIEYDPTRPLVDPVAGKHDIGLVDEAVLKILAEGKLLMPIEQANGQSDRCLALIIACLPEKIRKNLRFASFSPGEANKYTLAGMGSEGCVFAGWQRMMMAWLSGEYIENVESYIEEIRKFLASGDMAAITRTSQRHQLLSGSGSESLDKPRRETISAAMPVQSFPSHTSPGPQVPAAIPGSHPAGNPWSRPAASSASSMSRSKPVKRSPLKRKNSPSRASSRRPGISRSTAIRGVVLVLVLAMAGTAGVMWKKGSTLAESLEWAYLQELMGELPRTERAATLLEVVDVGDVYSRQLKLVTSSGKGLNPSVDRGRQKALGNLRELAGVPLAQQVELFAKLAADGIQQGSRPDRESQRMQSLANQGLVLENELARLELAWYSLAAGVFWQDVSTLPDQAVVARRDSLAKAGKGVLQDARRDLGTQDAKLVLDQTRGHVSGMASLLTLFEAKSYSGDWEQKLNRAARQVAPTASRMTRAYANSAFALVRLKKAERRGDQTSLPYARGLEDRDWPSAEIRSILINLRAQTMRFPKGQAPSLLTGTLDLYSALKKPVTLAAKVAESPRVLSNLEANRAVRFHPGSYDDFLERIRYEAAVIILKNSDDPQSIPDRLFADPDREFVAGFRDTMALEPLPEVWDGLAASTENPFLGRWAQHLSAVAEVDLARARQEFDEAWLECRKIAVRLQVEASAGRDWSQSWLNLHDRAQAIYSAHTGNLAADPERSLKLIDVTNLLVALKAPLPLGLLAGTIRLDQDRLLGPTRARLEIRLVPDGEVILSDQFQIGPGAPAGMGWVGTVSLDETLDISPGQGLEIKIISTDRDEVLLRVSCPSLADGTGPGGMSRPRSGGRGTVSLKIDPGYWKSLRVPDLGMIF